MIAYFSKLQADAGAEAAGAAGVETRHASDSGDDADVGGGGDVHGRVVVIGMIEEIGRCDFQAQADALGNVDAFEEAGVDDGRRRAFDDAFGRCAELAGGGGGEGGCVEPAIDGLLVAAEVAVANGVGANGDLGRGAVVGEDRAGGVGGRSRWELGTGRNRSCRWRSIPSRRRGCA